MLGTWTLQRAQDLSDTITFRVRKTAGGSTDPSVTVGDAGLSVSFMDGRYTMFPWPSVAFCEFVPDKKT